MAQYPVYTRLAGGRRHTGEATGHLLAEVGSRCELDDDDAEEDGVRAVEDLHDVGVQQEGVRRVPGVELLLREAVRKRRR